LRLDIDTGSSDVWANSASSNLCAGQSSTCSVSGTYTANQSTTYSYINSDFYIKYADNSGAQGDYATDVLTIGGTSIANVPFGIGYRSTSPQGIIGVGYASNEASVATTGQTYRNLPLVMQSAGVINTPAYSLWLNDLDANTGSILFGGVDTDKFQGTLETLPIIKEQGVYREFIIGLTGVAVAGQSIVSTAIPVLLDSGSSLSYLPTQYADAIFTIFNAQYSSQAGAAVVSCSYMNSQETFDFTFSGVTIKVPMNEMVIVDGVRKGQQICILGKH
jgi:Eukaryotic aspartyl protease